MCNHPSNYCYVFAMNFRCNYEVGLCLIGDAWNTLKTTWYSNQCYILLNVVKHVYHISQASICYSITILSSNWKFMSSNHLLQKITCGDCRLWQLLYIICLETVW